MNLEHESILLYFVRSKELQLLSHSFFAAISQLTLSTHHCVIIERSGRNQLIEFLCYLLITFSTKLLAIYQSLCYIYTFTYAFFCVRLINQSCVNWLSNLSFEVHDHFLMFDRQMFTPTFLP